jgi:hypothetical protein
LLIRKDSGQLAKKKIDANSGGKGASSSSGQGASKDVQVRPGTIMMVLNSINYYFIRVQYSFWYRITRTIISIFIVNIEQQIRLRTTKK